MEVNNIEFDYASMTIEHLMLIDLGVNAGSIHPIVNVMSELASDDILKLPSTQLPDLIKKFLMGASDYMRSSMTFGEFLSGIDFDGEERGF